MPPPPKSPPTQARLAAARFRESVLASYQDILAGRTTEYKGSIEAVIKQAQARNQPGAKRARTREPTQNS